MTRRFRVLAVVLAVLVSISACQDHDPLAPIPPQRGIPKPNMTLSGNVTVSSPVDMNTAGEVLGSFGAHAGISFNGVAYDLGPSDSSDNTLSYPVAINSGGQVVTNEYTGSTAYGVLWTPDEINGTTGKFVRVPDGATVLDINDAGEIIGSAGTAIFLWSGTHVLVLPLPTAGDVLYSGTINQFGQIAGTLVDANGATHTFLWTPSSPNGTSGDYVLLEAPGVVGGRAGGLNDLGQVVVNGADGIARLWTPASPNGTSGSFVALNGPFGPLSGADINNRGDVLADGDGPVAYYCGPTTRIYLWRPDTPNGSTGVTINLTPDVGAAPRVDGFYVTDVCWAFAGFVSEEENEPEGASIQAFGQTEDAGGGMMESFRTISNLDQLQTLTANFTWSGCTWRGCNVEGDTVLFDAGGTTPYTAGQSFHWEFGDGTSGTGVTIAHSFGDNGQYPVRLTVTDSGGRSSTVSRTDTISNRPPSATFTPVPTVPEGGTYVLTLTNVSDAPADLPSLQLALDCGDGVGYRPVGGHASLACSAPNEVVRTVRAQLRDKDGGVTEYAAQVSVLNVAPAVTILSASATISERDTYTISFRFTDPGPLDSWRYSFDWGDGTSITPINVSTQGGTISGSHRYSVNRRGGTKSATYIVTVGVSDDAGAVGAATSTVVVSSR